MPVRGVCRPAEPRRRDLKYYSFVGLADSIAQLEDARLLAAMFERAPLGIAIADLSGRYVRANPTFLRLLGYTEEELIDRTIHDVTHPLDKSEASCAKHFQ